ncbi:MAG TPA: hypothetical protein VLV15_00365, partial [Dongiaceae bacterium]|nr:hypothetical protein [Dongiaceae bacterium]
MTIERVAGGACTPPFPVHPRLVETLLAGHTTAGDQRDPTVAHVLATCAGYAYADTDTVARMMTRLGLERHACVRITRTVDAMFIFSTAYLVQSRCGRVVMLCYRGTEPGSLGNWLGDADLGPEDADPAGAEAGARIRFHAGFHRNVRATWWEVLETLTVALRGGSIADDKARVEHPMEALYVTGHSLGGAMALLFAWRLSADPARREIADRLRAVYTFGQPMAFVPPLSPSVEAVGR